MESNIKRRTSNRKTYAIYLDEDSITYLQLAGYLNKQRRKIKDRNLSGLICHATKAYLKPVINTGSPERSVEISLALERIRNLQASIDNNANQLKLETIKLRDLRESEAIKNIVAV